MNNRRAARRPRPGFPGPMARRRHRAGPVRFVASRAWVVGTLVLVLLLRPSAWEGGVAAQENGDDGSDDGSNDDGSTSAPAALYPDCEADMALVGDSLCDLDFNVAECGFDGGDCCELPEALTTALHGATFTRTVLRSCAPVFEGGYCHARSSSSVQNQRCFMCSSRFCCSGALHNVPPVCIRVLLFGGGAPVILCLRCSGGAPTVFLKNSRLRLLTHGHKTSYPCTPLDLLPLFARTLALTCCPTQASVPASTQGIRSAATGAGGTSVWTRTPPKTVRLSRARHRTRRRRRHLLTR